MQSIKEESGTDCGAVGGTGKKRTGNGPMPDGTKLVYTKVQAEYQTAKEKLPYETIEEAEKHLAQTVGALEKLRKIMRQ